MQCNVEEWMHCIFAFISLSMANIAIIFAIQHFLFRCSCSANRSISNTLTENYVSANIYISTLVSLTKRVCVCARIKRVWLFVWRRPFKMHATFDNYVGILSSHKLSMRIVGFWFKSMQNFIKIYLIAVEFIEQNQIRKQIRWETKSLFSQHFYTRRNVWSQCANSAKLNQLNGAFLFQYTDI